MKYLIKENQLNNTIESYLKSSYPGINEVTFRDIPIGHLDDNGEYIFKQLPEIKIIFNPNTTPKGNLDKMKFRDGLKSELKGLFGLGESEQIRINLYEMEITLKEI